MTTGPSPHLSWAELACKDGTPYPEAWRTTRLPALAEVFETLRRTCGDRPIVVRSAYRTHAYQAALMAQGLTASSASQHPEGRALDLQPPEGFTAREFYRVVKEEADKPGSAIGGIGLYRTFVHVDVRPRPSTRHIALWDYSGLDRTRIA